VIDSLLVAASERGVKVALLTPDSLGKQGPNSLVEQTLQSINKKGEADYGRSLIDHRPIAPAATRGTVTVVIIDRSASLVIEEKDDSQLEFADAVGLATFSRSGSTVKASISFFETTWEAVNLIEREKIALESEKRSRKSAELLQDILSHDIKNYNQIVVSSAEMLRASVASAQERESLIDAILKATAGSSDLIRRAKELGRVRSQSGVERHPVDVEPALQKSSALIIKAHPERSISLPDFPKSGTKVLADDMLEEVFTNILSNAVNYAGKNKVLVEIQVEEVEGAIVDEKRRSYWMITFTDHGKGIPDKMKEKVFTRYLDTAAGTGLGLSIVHALVVERYSGKVAITDRVQGDYKKGTRVTAWLPKA
jgi:signal transduction histidine kinase